MVYKRVNKNVVVFLLVFDEGYKCRAYIAYRSLGILTEL